MRGAAKQSFALVPTSELYRAVCSLLEDPDEALKRHIRKSILTSSGPWFFTPLISRAVDGEATPGEPVRVGSFWTVIGCQMHAKSRFLVERIVRNDEVVGSIPTSSTDLLKHLRPPPWQAWPLFRFCAVPSLLPARPTFDCDSLNLESLTAAKGATLRDDSDGARSSAGGNCRGDETIPRGFEGRRSPVE
jgi:hypothetical protein